MRQDELRGLDQESVKARNNQHLVALWHDQNGEWDEAHRIVQKMEDVTACRIHAYLHRKEGDIPNSQYWYQRAGIPYDDQISFDQEVADILQSL